MHNVFLGLSVFLACVVEMIEALTIVLAIGISREWRSALLATVAAVLSLTVVVIAFEPFLWQAYNGSNRSVQRLWLFMGALLLIFGLQWLRKAILRYTGILPIHDEDQTYTKLKTGAEKKALTHKNGIDWYGFAIVFKGVLLEGFEVIFIVLAFGSNDGNIGLGVEAAIAAFILIAGLGFFLHKPLSKLPENNIKFVVSIILTTFGTYFSIKGLGIAWPHGEDSVLGILAFYIVTSYYLIISIRARQKPKTVKV
jgi:uncharacterized membrane protein